MSVCEGEKDGGLGVGGSAERAAEGGRWAEADRERS